MTTSENRRRTQNREAQRRFRDKQAKQAQQSKKQFEELTSKYKALVAENHSLKCQHPAQVERSARMSDESFEVISRPANPGWSPAPLPPSCMAGFTDDFESELLSLQTPPAYPCTPQASDPVFDARSASVLCGDGLPYDPSRDVPIPTIEHSLTDAGDPSVAGTWTLPRPVSDDSCLDSSTALLYPNPSLPLSLSGYDNGLARNAAGSVPRSDLVQALIQLAFTQERIALIDLEKAKLRACAC
jgi:hypothetical protein